MVTSSPAPWWKQWQAYLKALPQPATEESIPLRILVQAMVIVGVVATDVAAQTTWSFWAIPLSIIGSWWSWRRRKKQNVALKFLLAIAMIGMLFVFLGNLVENLNASQVALAGLLVQLQVLHSFDLPRRKDLGYSMVIGLILLGVAGTLSQTLAFAPWLLLFLAVALPALVLDYRSRLGLVTPWPFSKKRSSQESSPQSRPSSKSPLFTRSLPRLLALVLALGLVIFALMPRFPGYKFQSFPVSGPGEMQQQTFNDQNQDIRNPGYGNGTEDGEGGRGQNRPGTIDDTFYYGFNSRMNQNLRGEMTKKLVLRVRSQAAGFWKALSFDTYTGQGWEISSDEISKIRRSPWSYRFVLDSLNSEMPTETIVQTYTAVEDLPNVVPSLYHPKALYFPTQEIGLDRNGSLRSPVGLLKDITYTVISEVPKRDRTRLKDYRIPPNVRIHPRLLEVPPALKDRVRQRAQELLAKADRPLETPYEIALYLAQALKQNYRIQPDMPFLGEEEDLVEAFLFRHGGGLPDHFSTVLTVMLRSLDIPARLTVGFGPGQFNPFTGLYLVHNTDAYAVTDVLFPGLGWYLFDPIPGHPLYPPSIEDVETFGVLKQFWRWIAGWLPSPVTEFLAQMWGYITQALWRWMGGLWQFISGSLLGVLVGLMAAIALAFGGWIGWQGGRQWWRQRRWAQLHPMARSYYQLLDLLQRQGLTKARAQTPREFTQSLREHLPPDQWERVSAITQAYTAWRYGDIEPDWQDLTDQFRQLHQSLSRPLVNLGRRRP